ncbi:SdpI family protein [Macrococcus equipercicus]|uniref:SdpI family protein n=1 Tax=Macrococcus equipercicus TaxID=69967 RepID=A0ABQ6R656_9STAP|nr:SdpI family protein [Macrococcus equipercicus]KAA1036044.1 SdpI family protein [Macrococcus equipercicus]
MILFFTSLLSLLIIILISRSNIVEDRNIMIGYRSRQSLKSPKHWAAAQKYSNNLAKKIFSLLIILGIFFSVYELIKGMNLYSVTVQTILIILGCIWLIISTEKYLKSVK